MFKPRTETLPAGPTLSPTFFPPHLVSHGEVDLRAVEGRLENPRTFPDVELLHDVGADLRRQGKAFEVPDPGGRVAPHSC